VFCGFPVGEAAGLSLLVEQFTEGHLRDAISHGVNTQDGGAMTWPEFVCVAVGIAVLGILLIGLIGFVATEIVAAPDPEERWAEERKGAA
jgi:hypothetical protein